MTTTRKTSISSSSSLSSLCLSDLLPSCDTFPLDSDSSMIPQLNQCRFSYLLDTLLSATRRHQMITYTLAVHDKLIKNSKYYVSCRPNLGEEHKPVFCNSSWPFNEEDIEVIKV